MRSEPSKRRTCASVRRWLDEELGVGRFAELAVEPAGLGQRGDFGVDQAARQNSPWLLANALQRGFVDQLVEQGRGVVGDRGVTGFGILLAGSGEQPFHRGREIALADLFVIGLGERAAAAAETAADAAHVGHGEAGDDRQQEQRRGSLSRPLIWTSGGRMTA